MIERKNGQMLETQNKLMAKIEALEKRGQRP